MLLLDGSETDTLAHGYRTAPSQLRAGSQAPGGWLLIAVPLPLQPHVHVGPATVDPEEMLPADRSSWEAAARELERALLRPLGYDVRALARTPYLCRGGSRRPVVQLDDALFLCTRAVSG